METFKDIINGEKPVLVDFYATWCGPCKTMSPIIDKIALLIQGQARIIKIDIDKNQGLAMNLKIQSVPTFIIFKRGEIVWRSSGTIDKVSLLEQLKYFID